MVDVTRDNFEEVFPRLELLLKKCAFVALDCEFTALPWTPDVKMSYMDSGSDRYQKIRQNIHQCFPLQVGLVPFTYDRDLTEYKATIYKFSVFPKPFGPYDDIITFQPSTIHFLQTYNFDFNKVFCHGIPCLNKTQTKSITEMMEKATLGNAIYKILTYDESELVSAHMETVCKWLPRSSVGESITLEVGINAPHVMYLLHREIRRVFKSAWTYQSGICSSEITIEHLSEEGRIQQCKSDSHLDQETLKYIKGFSRVIDVLIRCKKPIIGHNALLDLLTCYHFYYDYLPNDYKVWKRELNQLFPSVYDTKFMSFKINGKDSFKDSLMNITLQDLYNSLKNAHEQRYANVKLELGVDSKEVVTQLHDAGWDAYITGYCFISMCHLLNSGGKSSCIQKMTRAELTATAAEFKNKVQLSMASIQYISLDGPDPISLRPPHLVVSHSSRLNLKHLHDILSGCGHFEMKPMSRYRIRIVPPNQTGYEAIIVKLLKHQEEFTVENYSLFKHNKLVRSFCFLGLVVPTGLTIWLFLSK